MKNFDKVKQIVLDSLMELENDKLEFKGEEKQQVYSELSIEINKCDTLEDLILTICDFEDYDEDDAGDFIIVALANQLK